MSNLKLIIKQIKRIQQNEIPNIKVFVNKQNLTKFDVIMCFKKDKPEDDHPRFYPKDSTAQF